MYYRKDRVPKSVTRPSKERKDVSLSIVFARRKKKLLLEGTFSIIKYLTPCHLQIPRKNYKDAQTQNGAHENQSISEKAHLILSCASLSRKRRTGKFEVDAKPVIEFVKGWKARERVSRISFFSALDFLKMPTLLFFCFFQVDATSPKTENLILSRPADSFRHQGFFTKNLWSLR